MAQNNLLGAGKRLVTAAKGRVMSAAEQKAAAARKKIGAVGSTGARLTRAATTTLNRAAMQLEGSTQSTGPSTRGGKRAVRNAAAGPSTRGGKRGATSAAPAPAPMVDKKPAEVTRKPVAKSAKPAAKPAAKKPSTAPAAAAPTRTVSSIAADYFNNPKTQAGEESYAMHQAYLESTKSKPKDVKIGGIAGRTGGKWHLGKRPGKG